MQPNDNEFNLAGVMHAWRRQWKLIIVFVAISLAVASILLLLLPKQYEATAVATAGNPLLSDKAYLFNPNIDQLYSNYGSADDLDRLYGIANLDSTYKVIVDFFNLVDYYKSTGANNAIRRRKAVFGLKKDVEIQKNEVNQLTVSVWNKDPALAANIANSIIEVVQQITAAGLKKSNEQSLFLLDSTLAGLVSKYGALVGSGNNATGLQAGRDVALFDVEKTTLLEQIKQYQKTYSEVALASKNIQPALIVLQTASPWAKAGKPRVLAWLFGVLVASFSFGLLAVLLYDRKPL